MVDVARLTVTLDSSDLAKGKGQLKVFATEGKRTEAQIVRSADRMEKELAQTAIAAQKLSKGFRGNGMRNAAMQLSQVGQQTMATGNLIQSLAIQLPDLALGFGAVGIMGGVAAGALLPLAANALGLGEQSETLAEQIDAVSEALAQQEAAAELAGMSTAQLDQKYGQFASTMQTTLSMLSNIAAREAQRQIDGLSESLGDLLGTAGDGEGRAALAGFFDVNIMLAFTDKAREARAEARGLTQEFQSAQRALVDANGDIDQQIMATQRLLSAANDLALSKDGINNQEAELIKQLSEALEVMIAQKEATLDAGSAAASLAAEARALADPIGAAADEAARLANNLNAAMAAQRSSNLASQYAQYGAGRVAGEGLIRENSALYGGNGDVLTAEKARLANLAKRAEKSSRSGGISKAAREAQRSQNELDREAERIIEGLKSAHDKYNDSIAQATKLREAGVLSQEQYNAQVAQLGQEFKDQQPFVREYKDSLIDAAMGGADAFDSLRDAIIRAGLEYALFGTGQFAPSGGGGWGGLLTGLLPSFDGGGFTGSGSRTGGMDGKGGTLAMVHPNETVVDHTKGQSVGGGSVELIVRNEPGTLVEIARNEAGAAIRQAEPGIQDRAVKGAQMAFRRTKQGWSP
tara:strand:- start:2144 stop:4051 length:1908 start_codon:yes stop_codon:yes gene_type:complete